MMRKFWLAPAVALSFVFGWIAVDVAQSKGHETANEIALRQEIAGMRAAMDEQMGRLDAAIERIDAALAVIENR